MFFDGVREGRALRNQLNNEWTDQHATLSQIRRPPLRARATLPDYDAHCHRAGAIIYKVYTDRPRTLRSSGRNGWAWR